MSNIKFYRNGLTDNMKAFNSLLQKQSQQSWQKFSEQHSEYVDRLSEPQLTDVKAVLALSDFIFNSAIQAPDLVIELFTSSQVYCQKCPDYQSMLAALLKPCSDEAQLHRALRRFRLKEMVRIAVADFLLDMPLESSLERLSLLADSLILGALDWLTTFCQQLWGVPQAKNGLNKAMPLLVYAMGKLGGRELNFSSDIDLIFTYPLHGETVGARRSLDNQQFFTRLGQKLITALHQKTVDGFVYRVDMRLRPFGESGPLVMSFNAMEDYYQEQGRDWERYAMLKARLLGNSEYHHELEDTLRPFVYRRYIDFSVIDSLRRMKAMIAQEVRRKNLVNNIKLGAGGIREIEFIVQVFQLIRGGRVKELRQRHLLSVLPILVSEGELSPNSQYILENAYRFLRRLENVIQALNDEQTQTLPDNELDQERILQVMNLKSWSEFLTILSQHMSGVHQEFISLIGEESPNHQGGNEHWLTLWHSKWEDEECIEWISREANFWQSDIIWQELKHFRENITKRSIGNRGRQVVDKLIPLLLWHLQQTQAQEITLSRTLIVFNKITTRTAYLELLFENEGALKHLIKLCQASQWVAEHIATYPILLDELIDPQLLNNPPALSNYALELREIMLRVPEDDVEAQMHTLRHFKQAQQLRIAAADIVGVLPLMKVSDHLTALAEAIISEVINLAWQQIAERFGVPESTVLQQHKGFTVIGYGKLGGRELSYRSDLDLVFLHYSEAKEVTNGNVQVLASVFYIKLAQRIMHIFNTRMASGILYELDMRLRPSGNSGLLVVHFNTFAQYQREDAWTWEHQALVRTRAVFGHKDVIYKFNRLRQQILALPRDQKKLAQDVIEMRNKMRKHLDKSDNHHIDIKQGFGGLVDIEFLAQFLVLNNSHQYPNIAKYSDNVSIFAQLHLVNIINTEQKKLLTQVYCKLRDQTHRAALQDETLLLDKTVFKQYAGDIVNICRGFLS
jgi:glutamate-ammonia-ligase adenylyltransferase